MVLEKRYSKALDELRNDIDTTGEDAVIRQFTYTRRSKSTRTRWITVGVAGTLLAVGALIALPNRAMAALTRIQSACLDVKVYHTRLTVPDSDRVQESWREGEKYRAIYDGYELGSNGKESWEFIRSVKEAHIRPDTGDRPPIMYSTYSANALLESITSDVEPDELSYEHVIVDGQPFDLITITTKQNVTPENAHLRRLKLFMYADPDTNLPVKIIYFTAAEGQPFSNTPSMVDEMEYPEDIDDAVFECIPPKGYTIMRPDPQP